MFHPLPLYVGLRYARARAHRYFVSFITWVSLAGVSVGVLALIVILSVMNGFGSELRDRLLELSAQVRITATGAAPDWEQVRAVVQALRPDASVERYAQMPALAAREPETLPLQLRAADPAVRQTLEANLVAGDLATLDQGNAVVLALFAAEQLGIGVGDPITLFVPRVLGEDLPVLASREFTVVGLFEAGIPDQDGAVAYASLAELAGLGAEESGGAGLAINVGDVADAPAVARSLRAALAARWPDLAVTDWTQEHASYFRAIRIEKTMMALILLLIVAVAAFNIVAMLVMVVTDKRTDIAILRTFGASPRAVASVFLSQGLVIGWLGVFAGVVLGVLVALNVAPILGFLHTVAGFTLFDADVYYFTDVPSELHVSDVLLVAVSALVVTALATVYPALRAARVSPAEALRYE